MSYRRRPHQQQCRNNVRLCRSNIRPCRKNRSTCSIRQCNVASFDVVAGVDRALDLCAGSGALQENVRVTAFTLSSVPKSRAKEARGHEI